MFEDGRETPVESPDGSDPAGRVRIGSPGIHVIGYRSAPSPIELEPRKFEQYLAEEGLETIITARSKRGESGQPGREIYSRCAKCVLFALGRASVDPGRRSKSGSTPKGEHGKRAGKAGSTGYDRVLGFTLELVPRANPFLLQPGARLPVEVLFQGRPLAGALVVAMNADEPEHRISARSDQSGRVSLQLEREGAWLVKAVHMVPASSGADADWESLWASLTFELPAMDTDSRAR
jgi:hypothetical protein